MNLDPAGQAGAQAVLHVIYQYAVILGVGTGAPLAE
jgi:hypothetical protein